MSGLNVNGREHSLIIYRKECSKELWDDLCIKSGRNPLDYNWIRMNFDTSDVDDCDDITDGNAVNELFEEELKRNIITLNKVNKGIKYPTIHEVDIIDRKTGRGIECIYSGTDSDEAYTIAEEYNQRHVEWYDSDYGFGEYQDGKEGTYADVFHCETPEQVNGICKY